MFVGMRVPFLIEINDLGAVGSYPSPLDWMVRAVPITLIAYVAAAIPGVLLARDGLARWCWIPASMLFVLGAPIQTWLAWDPVVARALGAPAGIAMDLVAVLLPAGAAASISTERRAVDRARVVGAGVVFALILAWQVPVAISETSVSVGLVAFLLGFATLWRIEGIGRVIAFSVIALAVSRFSTILIFEGPAATGVAFRESFEVMVVAAVCLLVTPLTHVILRRSLARKHPVPAT